MDRQWSVDIEIKVVERLDEELAEAVIEALQDRGPAVKLEGDRVNVRFDVAASDETAAFQEALGVVRRAIPHGEPVRIEMQTVDELERQLAESNVPACAAPAPDQPQG